MDIFREGLIKLFLPVSTRFPKKQIQILLIHFALFLSFGTDSGRCRQIYLL